MITVNQVLSILCIIVLILLLVDIINPFLLPLPYL